MQAELLPGKIRRLERLQLQNSKAFFTARVQAGFHKAPSFGQFGQIFSWARTGRHSQLFSFQVSDVKHRWGLVSQDQHYQKFGVFSVKFSETSSRILNRNLSLLSFPLLFHSRNVNSRQILKQKIQVLTITFCKDTSKDLRFSTLTVYVLSHNYKKRVKKLFQYYD